MIHGPHFRAFLILLGVIAIAGLAAGVILALGGYSSAGPFSVSAACVGVLGTLAAQDGKPGGGAG